MLGNDIRVLAGGRTGASFSLMATFMPPGAAPPPHVHDDEDEGFYVLEGRMRFKCGGDEWVVGPGGFVYLPRGVIHQPAVEGDQPARTLVITSKAGLDAFFSEFAAELARTGAPPSLELLDSVGAPHKLRHFPPGTI